MGELLYEIALYISVEEEDDAIEYTTLIVAYSLLRTHKGIQSDLLEPREQHLYKAMLQ